MAVVKLSRGERCVATLCCDGDKLHEMLKHTGRAADESWCKLSQQKVTHSECAWGYTKYIDNNMVLSNFQYIYYDTTGRWYIGMISP